MFGIVLAVDEPTSTFCIYVLKSAGGGGRLVRFEAFCLNLLDRGGGMSGIVETGWRAGMTALASVSVSQSFINCTKSAEGGEYLPLLLFDLLADLRVCFSCSFANFFVVPVVAVQGAPGLFVLLRSC